MTDTSMEPTTTQTALGPIPIWSHPGAFASSKPVILAITGAWAGPDDMIALQGVVGPAWDACVMRLPGNGAPDLAQTSIAAWARAVSETVDRSFAGRSVVLLGVSIGALVALGVRSARVRRVLALEPPLVMRKLWPMIDAVRERRRDHPQDRALIENIFGVTDAGLSDLTYFDLFRDLPAPVEVVVGDQPLEPRRITERYPSFVDEPERAWLRAQPGVTLHVAPDAGHNIHVFAARFLRDVVHAALNKTLSEERQAEGRLAAAIPLTAARVLFLGPGGATFAAALAARHPDARVRGAAKAAEAAKVAGELFDVVAVRAPAGDEAAALAEGGWLIAGDTAGPPPVGLEAWTPGPGGVMRARKPGCAPAVPLRLEMVVFAPKLMDIRTRLPAQALASETDLRVELARAPFNLPTADREEPKILILQRPALAEPQAWRAAMAEAIASGWVVVLEFDDHPRLIAELTGDPGAPPDWGRFAYQHAIQVSTPALKTFFQAYNPQVAVFPNAVFDLQPFPRGRDRPRVFFGGALRGPFVAEVARSLGPAIAAHPRTEFTVVGDRAFFEALPTGHKEFHDYLPYEGYLALMRRCAISLSPLEDRPLIETKSDAKFLDAASVGALTIASPPVYAATVVDGVNGLIARELDDWPGLLARALADPAWREGMARAAWDYVRAERMFAQQVPARKAWYRDLWARRDALNRALYARLPGLEAAVQAKGA